MIRRLWLRSYGPSHAQRMKVDDHVADQRGQRRVLVLELDREKLQSVTQPVERVLVEGGLYLGVRCCGRVSVLVPEVQLRGELFEPLTNG